MTTGVAIGLISRHHGTPNHTIAATTTTTTTTTTSSAQSSATNNPYALQCEKDWRIVVIAVIAYQHLYHANPVPPLPWSVANYVQDYGPLTDHTANHQPVLPTTDVPSPSHYEVYYDSQGNVFVTPPGHFDAPSTQADLDHVCNEVTAGTS